MNDDHQGSDPAGITVEFKKFFEHPVFDNLFLSGRIAKRECKKKSSGNAKISPDPDKMSNMQEVVKCYGRNNQKQIRDRQRQCSLYKDRFPHGSASLKGVISFQLDKISLAA